VTKLILIPSKIPQNSEWKINLYTQRYLVTNFLTEFPVCTGVVTNGSGIIVSPGYPLTPYKNNTDCTWTIKVRPGERIFVRFGDTQSDCSNDFLMLSGVEGGSKNLELLCGETVTGKNFMSKSNQLALRFRTSTFKHLKG
jgi:hypothetical protein